MDNQKEKILAIIPARGGSKRIPRKNIKTFLGVTVIKYSITAALESNIFDEIMVSTDDREIAKKSVLLGAKVPFMRSSQNSDDHSPLSEVIKEVLLKYSKKQTDFEYFACIYPVAPLIKPEYLRSALKLLKEKELDTVLSVIRYSHPIQRALEINKAGRLVMINKEFMNTRTQDLANSYYDAGQFFFMRTKAFLKKGKIFTDNVMGLELPMIYAQDIDNEEDWVNAEIKYEILNRKYHNTH